MNDPNQRAKMAATAARKASAAPPQEDTTAVPDIPKMLPGSRMGIQNTGKEDCDQSGSGRHA